MAFERNKLIFLDGAMGTMLQHAGLKPGELPELLNLGHHICHEFLSAEAGFHGHYQDHVALFQVRNGSLHGGLGL